MPYESKIRDTLLIPSGPANDPDRMHLHGVLTEKCENSCHFVVCIESIIDGAYHDDTCEVEPGEHEFIKKKSYVNYRRAQVCKADRLKKMVDGWVYRPKEPLSQQLWERMCQGIEKSKFTPRGMKDYYRKQADKLKK